MRFACAVASLVVLAAPVRAHVAIAAVLAPDDPAQRDLAATVASAARRAWDASPLLAGSQTACAAEDNACLRGEAKKLGASHVLFIGVAALGVRDHVVGAQLFAVDDATPIFEGSAVQPWTSGSFEQVNALVERLIHAPGPPLAAPRSPSTKDTLKNSGDPRRDRATERYGWWQVGCAS